MTISEYSRSKNIRSWENKNSSQCYCHGPGKSHVEFPEQGIEVPVPLLWSNISLPVACTLSFLAWIHPTFCTLTLIWTQPIRFNSSSTCFPDSCQALLEAKASVEKLPPARGLADWHPPCQISWCQSQKWLVPPQRYVPNLENAIEKRACTQCNVRLCHVNVIFMCG